MSDADAPTLPVRAATAKLPASATTRALAPADRRLGIGSGLPPFAPDPVLDAPAPRTRGPIVFGLIVFILFVGGFGAWSVLAPLAEAAIAPGVIKVEGQRRTVQHLEGGIVREILVRDGSKVEPGQVLLRLDDIQADSSLEALRAQRWALLAQDARLAAEMEMARAIRFPADLLGSPDPRAQEAVAGQRALFEARRASLVSQTDALRARIDQARAQISGAEGQLRFTRQQLDSTRQELQVRRDLLRQGLTSRDIVFNLESREAGVRSQMEALQGEIDRASAAIAENEQQIRALSDQRLQEASTEQRDVRARLAEAEEKLRAAADVRTRREVLAPEAGTVVNSRMFTVGGVLRPGDPILDLVPVQDRLVAEVNIQPMDIDVVYPGLQSEVRLPAFKQRLVPYLHGHVTWVAADVTVNEQNGMQYYRAFIEIDREQLAGLDGVFLTPGMPVEAHVQIGERSFLKYITQPIVDSFHRAFKEQ